MSQSLAQVAIVVRDYDEALSFYVGKLGFKLIEDTPVPAQNKRWVVVAPRGSSSAHFLLARAVGAEQSSRIGNQTGGRVFLFLNTDEFWRDFRAYQAKGVEFVREPSEQPYGTVAVFKDLYGNLWDLIQPRDAPVKFSLHPIGYVQSSIRALDEAPRQGSEGAPDAWLEVDPTFARGLFELSVGEKIIVITWLHVADRNVLEVHPRSNPAIPLAGVFTTRSPHRPNPLGLHRVTVREICGFRLRIGPIEVIDGTPVLDIKPVLVDCADG